VIGHSKGGALAPALALWHDIFPDVWDPSEVRLIPDLYDDQLKLLTVPAIALAAALEVLAYCHEVPCVPWTGVAVPQSNPLQRAGIEHLDSYLKKLGLYDDRTLSTLALYAPITEISANTAPGR